MTSVFARGKRCLYNGCGIGEINSAEKFSCFLVCDFTPYGNFRDLMGAARKYWNGEKPDEVVVGLAFVGLASNIGVLATQGGAAAALAPELAGVSLVKGLARAGRLATALATRIRKSLKEVIDFQALYGGLKKIHWNSSVSDVDDFKNTSVLNQERLEDFLSIMQKISALVRSDAGIRGTIEALSFSDDRDAFERVLRVAEARKEATAAALKVLGHDALTPKKNPADLMLWLGAGVAYFGLAVLIVRRMIVARRRLLNERKNSTAA